MTIARQAFLHDKKLIFRTDSPLDLESGIQKLIIGHVLMIRQRRARNARPVLVIFLIFSFLERYDFGHTWIPILLY